MVPSGIIDQSGLRVPLGSGTRRLMVLRATFLLVWSITVVLSPNWNVIFEGIIVPLFTTLLSGVLSEFESESELLDPWGVGCLS